MIEGMNRLGYAAANVTDQELAGGLDDFLDLARKAQFPLLSANIVFQRSGKGILPPYVIKTLPPESWRGDRPLRVGIVGLARENAAFLETASDGSKIIIAPPIEAAGALVPQVRSRSDVVIVLTDLNPINVERLVRAVPGIDLVLGGRGDQVSDNKALPPATRVLYAGDQGKRIGEIRLFFGRRNLMNTVATHLFLDRRYPADPRMLELEDDGNARINDHYRALAKENPVRMPSNLISAETFVGTETCAECHAADVNIWKGTGHSHAIATLIDRGQEFSPLCVRCHVTGYEKGNGFRNLIATPEAANVQCEACHGPAGVHVANPSLPYGKTGPEDCLVCHTKENSPDFDYGPYWERIQHPGGQP